MLLDLHSPPPPNGGLAIGTVSGTVRHAAQVDGLVGRILRELEAPGCPVIATGGHATELVISETRTITAVEPQLTLRGLRIAYERLSVCQKPSVV